MNDSPRPPRRCFTNPVVSGLFASPRATSASSSRSLSVQDFLVRRASSMCIASSRFLTHLVRRAVSNIVCSFRTASNISTSAYPNRVSVLPSHDLPRPPCLTGSVLSPPFPDAACRVLSAVSCPTMPNTVSRCRSLPFLDRHVDPCQFEPRLAPCPPCRCLSCPIGSALA